MKKNNPVTIVIHEEFEDIVMAAEALKFVAGLILSGYRSGVDPGWELSGGKSEPDDFSGASGPDDDR